MTAGESGRGKGLLSPGARGNSAPDQGFGFPVQLQPDRNGIALAEPQRSPRPPAEKEPVAASTPGNQGSSEGLTPDGTADGDAKCATQTGRDMPRDVYTAVRSDVVHEPAEAENPGFDFLKSPRHAPQWHGIALRASCQT